MIVFLGYFFQIFGLIFGIFFSDFWDIFFRFFGIFFSDFGIFFSDLLYIDLNTFFWILILYFCLSFFLGARFLFQVIRWIEGSTFTKPPQNTLLMSRKVIFASYDKFQQAFIDSQCEQVLNLFTCSQLSNIF